MTDTIKDLKQEEKPKYTPPPQWTNPKGKNERTPPRPQSQPVIRRRRNNNHFNVGWYTGLTAGYAAYYMTLNPFTENQYLLWAGFVFVTFIINMIGRTFRD